MRFKTAFYMTFRQTNGPAIAAAKAAISTATAYRHEHDHRLPSSQNAYSDANQPVIPTEASQ